MTDPRPQWLLDALRDTVAQAPQPGPSLADRTLILPGDIRQLIPMDDTDTPARLVLIQAVDEDRGYADVVLLSPEIPMAADTDVLLPPDLTGLAYPLLMLGEISAPVYLVQVAKLVGTVSLDALRRHVPAGEPVTDERDPRWTWKERELDSLTLLAAECTAELLDGPARSIVDPRSFATDADHDTLESAALAAARACRAGVSLLPIEVLQSLAGKPQADLATSSARVVLFELVSRLPASLLMPAGDAADVQIDAGGLIDSEALRGVIATCTQQGHRNIRLLSTAALWADAGFGVAYPHHRGGAVAVAVGGRRCQVLATLAPDRGTQHA